MGKKKKKIQRTLKKTEKVFCVSRPPNHQNNMAAAVLLAAASEETFEQDQTI